MRHTVDFLATILRKLLCTATFSMLNEDNPNSNHQTYARTHNLVIYRSSSHPNPGSILENDVVVGMIDSTGNMMLCTEDFGNNGITLHPVMFTDDDGYWCYNLWYSKASIGTSTEWCKDRKELLEKCSDFFIMLRPTLLNGDDQPVSEPIEYRTVICRSWRIRHETGELMLPVPHKDILL